MRSNLNSVATLIVCFAILVTASCGVPPNPVFKPHDEWYTYRYDNTRTGEQPYWSALSDPARVGTLSVKKAFPAGADRVPGAFLASPIVVNDTVFIASDEGVFYALDAATLELKWRYPKGGALKGSCTQGGNGTWGQYGIRSSATYARIGGQDAVILARRTPTPKGG